MLEQLFDDDRVLLELQHRPFHFQEFIAINKLLHFLQQLKHILLSQRNSSYSPSHNNHNNNNEESSFKKSKKNSKKSSNNNINFKKAVSPFKHPALPLLLSPLKYPINNNNNNNNMSPGKNSGPGLTTTSTTNTNTSLSRAAETTSHSHNNHLSQNKPSRIKERKLLIEAARHNNNHNNNNNKGASRSKTSSTTNNSNNSHSNISKSTTAVVVVPSLSLVPYYSVLVDGIYCHPMVISLCTSPDILEIVTTPVPPALPHDTTEGVVENDGEGEEETADNSTTSVVYQLPAHLRTLIPPTVTTTSTAGGGGPIPATNNNSNNTGSEQTRLAIKVYDVTESRESMFYVNMREYQLLANEIVKIYH
jgi:hypothetical protein